jgi:hypothetical protein
MKKPKQAIRKGRPELPSKRRRSRRVAVMVTESELAGLQELASEQGVSISTALHSILVRSLRRRSKA